MSICCRYCGGTLTCRNGETVAQTIISATLPFQLGVGFNSQDPSSTLNRGFCLNFNQIPC